MPFVLALFPLVVYALLSLVTVVGGVILARLIVALVGQVPVVGGWLSDHVEGYVATATNAIVRFSKGSWTHVAQWVRAHAWIMSYSLSLVVDVLTHHADQFVHLSGTTIPAARDGAIAHADTLATSLQHNIDSNSARESTDVAVLNADISSVRGYVNGPFAATIHGQIADSATQTLSGAEGYTDAHLKALSDQLNAAIASVSGDLAHVETVIIPQLSGEISAQTAQERADIVTQRQQELADIQQLRSDLASQLSAAQSAEAAALDNVKSGIEVQLNAQAADNARALADSIAVQDSKLASAEATINGQIAIDQANTNTAIDALSSSIGLALAGIVSQVASISRTIDTCMVSTCDGPNNIAQVLKGLATGINTAEIVAFLSSAIENPHGVSGEIVAQATGLFGGAQTLLEGILSV